MNDHVGHRERAHRRRHRRGTALILGVSFDKPGQRPAYNGLKILSRLKKGGYEPGYLAGDLAYNNSHPDEWQLPVRALGYEPVYDYASTNSASSRRQGLPSAQHHPRSEERAKHWQALGYGSSERQKIYFRLHKSIEGYDGFAKNPLAEATVASGSRGIRGIAAQTILSGTDPTVINSGHRNRRSSSEAPNVAFAQKDTYAQKEPSVVVRHPAEAPEPPARREAGPVATFVTDRDPLGVSLCARGGS